MIKQRTLNNEIRVVGVGVHTGEPVTLILKPSDIDTGMVFRIGETDIPAQAAYVGDTTLSTSLHKAGVRISTVEHVMSAAAGLGIDNLLLELQGPCVPDKKGNKVIEVPIMDGSAAAFVFSMKAAGIREQAAPKKFLKIIQTVKVQEGDGWAMVEPFEGFKASFTLDYDHPILRDGVQEVTLDFAKDSYEKALSRARTFGFLSDYDWLRANNLGLGASLDNAVVLNEGGIMNPEGLRTKDELVKHKILDAMGDLYLLGMSLVGAFRGFKSGHRLNNRLVKAILDTPESWEIVSFEDQTAAPEYFLHFHLLAS